MTSLVDASQIAMALAVFLGAIIAVIAWFYRRGGREHALANALADNTVSNKELTAELKDFKAETVATLRDHDWRLKILEDQPK